MRCSFRNTRATPTKSQRICEACVMLACFSRVAEVLLAASHGHISVLRQRAPANSKHCQCVYRELREAHDRTTARWPSAPWMLARASTKRMRCPCGLNTMNTRRCVALFVTLGLRPRKANASSEMCKHCQCGFRYLREAHDRTTARWPTAPWTLARASAKRIKHCWCRFSTSRRSHARCSARARIRAPSASVCE